MGRALRIYRVERDHGEAGVVEQAQQRAGAPRASVRPRAEDHGRVVGRPRGGDRSAIDDRHVEVSAAEILVLNAVPVQGSGDHLLSPFRAKKSSSRTTPPPPARLRAREPLPSITARPSRALVSGATSGAPTTAPGFASDRHVISDSRLSARSAPT